MNHHHGGTLHPGTRARAIIAASRDKLGKLLMALALVVGAVAPLATPQTASAAISSATVGGPAHANSKSITVGRPTTVADKDVLIAQIVVRGITATNAVCAPAGWQAIRESAGDGFITLASFYRVVSQASTEVASYDFTVKVDEASCAGSGGLISNNTGITGAILRYSGVDNVNPVQAHDGIGSTSGSTDHVAPAVTTTAPNARVIRLYGIFRNDALDPSTNRIYTAAANGGGQRAAAAFDSVQAAIGSTGTHTATSATAEWSAQTIALREADPVPPTSSASATADGATYASNAWTRHDVDLTLSAVDSAGGSGVKEIVYSVNGAPTVTAPGSTVSLPFTAQGTTTVTYFARDNAGNTETPSKTFTVRIDKTLPTISGAPDRAPDHNGWYDHDVTVSFACNDALSGIAHCTGPVALDEGRDLEVTGTATDAAGNTNIATVSGIDVDTTAPLLTGTPTGSPNGAGWYDADVTIAWTCSDPDLDAGVPGVPGSGIDGTCPADSTIVGEGENLTSSTSVSDVAGNDTTAFSSPGVNIDRTPPVTTDTAPAGWNGDPVIVELNATDNLSGVATTHYELDGAGAQTGDTVTIDADGIHVLEYWSVDNAGNVEDAKSVEIKVDTTAPSIGQTLDPVPNAAGWNRSDVTVHFTCADGGSGIASCTTPQTVTTDGAGQSVVGTAVDDVGNEATSTATVNLDTVDPTISGAPDRVSNSNGWYHADVTVSFTCGDALSGLDSCTDPVLLGEGENQTITGSATDVAGNTASDTVSDIDIDVTAPTLTGAPTASPNDDGWYHGDVTIEWTCSDALSGIDGTCPVDGVIGGEGVNQSATATVSDRAGNTMTTTVDSIKIDRTAPNTEASGLPVGWSNSNVDVTFSADDGLSGVATTWHRLNDGAPVQGTSVQITDEGVHTLSYWSVDVAGNVEDANTVSVQIDKTEPTITPTYSPEANANGWNNGSVTVTFECDDPVLADGSPGSGIAVCPDDVTFEDEGTPEIVVVAFDHAANQGVRAIGVKIDLSDPTIDGSRAPDANAHGWNNTDVTVTFSCEDTGGSGIVGCGPNGTLTTEGADQAVTGTATDAADNTAATTVANVSIDKTAPGLSGVPTSSPNDADWYNDDVAIDWTCNDVLAGIDVAADYVDGCPADSVITGEGEELTASESVTDRAGNQTTATSTAVRIDRTAPTTTASPVSPWSNDATVTVTLTPNDNLSGVAATRYTIDGGAEQAGTNIVFGDEGVYNLEFWSVDLAGNIEVATGVTVRIDRTLPTITHTLDPAPNDAGWNRTDVDVDFDCDDDSSGIASCGPDARVTTDGDNQSVIGIAIDSAGNSNTDEATVNRDTKAPTIDGSRTPDANANGWNNGAVAVSFSCIDQLSGIAATNGCVGDTVLDADGADQSATGTATDAAGNTAGATVSGINIDMTAPTVVATATTADDAVYASDAWTNQTVTVTFSCTDALSGVVADDCPDPVMIGDNTSESGQEVSGDITDLAGNTGVSNTIVVKVDKQNPDLADVPFDVTAEATGASGAAVTWTDPTANDPLSGVASVICAPASGSTFALGTTLVTCTATDNVGNSNSSTFNVVVEDTTAATISGTPSNIVKEATSPAGAPASWAAPTADDLVDGSVPVHCVPPSGSTFAMGTTLVTCTATDAAGNPATQTFNVTVNPKPYALFAIRSVCSSDVLDWSGSQSKMTGNVHSNSGIKVGGSKNSVTGGTTYRCSMSDSKNTYTPAPVNDTDVWPDPISRTASDFACSGSVVNGTLELSKDGPWWVNGTRSSKQLVPGVYCATGLIKLSDSGITGMVTLVAPRIEISGSNINLTAHSHNVVALATAAADDAIKISGSSMIWSGHVYAPLGRTEVSGSKITAHNGGVVASTIKLNGSNISFTAPRP